MKLPGRAPVRFSLAIAEITDRVPLHFTNSLCCADDAALKRAKRDKLLATHPDKLGADAIGANLAVGRVTQVAACSSPLPASNSMLQLDVYLRLFLLCSCIAVWSCCGQSRTTWISIMSDHDERNCWIGIHFLTARLVRMFLCCLVRPSSPSGHLPLQWPPSLCGVSCQALEVLTDARQRRLYDEELESVARLSQAFAEQAASASDQPRFVLSDLKCVRCCTCRLQASVASVAKLPGCCTLQLLKNRRQCILVAAPSSWTLVLLSVTMIAVPT